MLQIRVTFLSVDGTLIIVFFIKSLRPNLYFFSSMPWPLHVFGTLEIALSLFEIFTTEVK